MTVAEALREAAARLSPTSDTARLDAELLMAHALGTSRSQLLTARMRDVAPHQFSALVARRQAHEPVAYILGEQEFYGLPFRVSPDVLIPRADSEVLVEAALRARPEARCVLDCGTGSGALLLAVLANLPGAAGIGMDRSPAALAIAQDNAARLQLAQRARMILADWDQPGWTEIFDAPFDLILANPPYVETEARLGASVREFEPAGALFAGSEGLDAYRVLIPQLPSLLTQDGIALMEIGATQAEPVSAIAGLVGLNAALHYDLGGRPRVLELSKNT